MTCRGLAPIAALAIAAPVADARAYPAEHRLAEARYGIRVSCALCHGSAGGTERNDYGRAWQDAGEDEAAFARVEGADSDGDGASNLDELRGGSHPADARSTPGAPGAPWANRDDARLVPAEQLELVLGAVERIDVVEVDLDASAIEALGARAGTAPEAADRAPTLYFGVRDGARTEAAVFVAAQDGDLRVALLAAVRATGELARAAIFRAGEEEGAALMPLVRCLEGADLATWARARAQCPAVAATAGLVRAVERALRRALAVVAVAVPIAAAQARPHDRGPTVSPAGADAREPVVTPPLAFDALRATYAEERLAPELGALAALLLALAWAGGVLGIVRLARGRGGPPLDVLSTSPGAIKITVTFGLLALLATQAVAATDAVIQTTVVHPSASAYFRSLSTAHLLGTSHAHLFGYALLYGVVAALLAGARAPEGIKEWTAAVLLSAGVVDVACWWLVRAGAGAAEWLMILTGAATSVGSLLACALILRTLWSSTPVGHRGTAQSSE